MNVISLVPSWTETLVACGVSVVGRTRYCVHPHLRVDAIPVVGGTKQADWERLGDAAVDLVVMDKEENTRDMADHCPYPVLATHVRSLPDVARDCRRLAERLGTPALAALAARWDVLSATAPVPRPVAELPGVIRWLKRPGPAAERCVYVIWRRPWMAAGPGTFIGAVLTRLGVVVHPFDAPYPTIDLDHLDPHSTVLLFSTEPYPFARRLDELGTLPFATALVDGEAFSWFGVRSLDFLERYAAPGGG